MLGPVTKTYKPNSAALLVMVLGGLSIWFFEYNIHTGAIPIIATVGPWAFLIVWLASVRVSLNGVERPDEIGSKISESTVGPLLKKAVHQFDDGHELDFGAIRASREQGLKIKRPGWLGLWWRTDEIPWNWVQSYRIERERFMFVGLGEGGQPVLDSIACPTPLFSCASWTRFITAGSNQTSLHCVPFVEASRGTAPAAPCARTGPS